MAVASCSSCSGNSTLESIRAYQQAQLARTPQGEATYGATPADQAGQPSLLLGVNQPQVGAVSGSRINIAV